MSDVLLGVIAGAVSLMALVQLGAILVGIQLAKRVDRLAQQIEHDVKPLLLSLSAVSDEAQKAARLATTQIERLDQVFSDVAVRVDQTLTVAHAFVGGPARQGMAVLAGVRAAVMALRGMREASRRRSAVRAAAVDDEESLFIG